MDKIDINEINESNMDKYDSIINNEKNKIFRKESFNIDDMNQLNIHSKLQQKINELKEKEQENKFIENMKKINDTITLELNNKINESNNQINKNISYTYNDYKNCIKKCKGYGEGDAVDEYICCKSCYDNPDFNNPGFKN